MLVFHLADECAPECTGCKKTDSLVKVLSTFTTGKKRTKKTSVGTITEDFIETSREDLRRDRKVLEKKR